ncbi:MAG TPA: hypothetical protein ENK77_02950 [Epsilonproteobacteria bacterium]|nr:hypothetical protein [Campylobacterota bacterium]
MAKMTMHQELDMLRKEVERLKREKEEAERRAAQKALEEERAKKEEESEAEQSIEAVKEKAGEIQEGIEYELHELVDTLKKEYENLSPLAAVVLFALGAAFGRALSSN